MRVTKAIYMTCTDKVETKEQAIGCLHISDCLISRVVPESWIKIKEIEIDIPDDMIDNIISSNTDIESQIKKHEAAINELKKQGLTR